MNKILEEDFKIISDSDKISFEAFRGKHFLISGGTGLIGSLCTMGLAYIEQHKQLGIKIYVIVRNINKARLVLGEFVQKTYVTIIENDIIRDIPEINDKIDYVIHTAAITNSKMMVDNPVLTIKTAIWGTYNMLECAKEFGARLVNLSSMEVYGDMGQANETISENRLGTIDLSSIRSCYPESKRMGEMLCKAYMVEYKTDVISVRLAQCFGPGISTEERRVFAQFARAVIDGRDIILHTKGESEGNYVYTRDAILAILYLLQNGISGETYNVNNEDCHMTIGNMAHMVADNIAKGSISVVYDIPNDIMQFGYPSPVKLHMSSKKINQLGWKASVGLQEAYERLIAYLKISNDEQ